MCHRAASFPDSGFHLDWSLIPSFQHALPCAQQPCLPASSGFSHLGLLYCPLGSGFRIHATSSVSSLSCCFLGVCSLLGPQWVLCPVCWWPHPPHSWLLCHYRKASWRTRYSAPISSEYWQWWEALVWPWCWRIWQWECVKLLTASLIQSSYFYFKIFPLSLCLCTFVLYIVIIIEVIIYISLYTIL